jgi:hypothetical protein
MLLSWVETLLTIEGNGFTMGLAEPIGLWLKRQAVRQPINRIKHCSKPGEK